MKKITEPRYMYFLLILSWLVYFVGYLARLNYGAVMAEIILSEGVSRTSAGLVSTGSALTYAAGQVISGFLGDRFSPRYVMFGGLLATAICNLLMPFAASPEIQLIIWCINGFAQAMLWPPMLRIFTECYLEQDLSKMYVRVSTSTTAGTIAVYLLASFCIAVSGWKTVFYISSCAGILVAVFWLWGMGRIEKHREAFGVIEAGSVSSVSETKPALSLLFGTVITSAMYGANLMLITAVPAHFAKYGKASTLTGVLNAFTYAGSALSTYGIGALSESFGWNASLFTWLVAAAAGTLLCVLSIRRWTQFLCKK